MTIRKHTTPALAMAQLLTSAALIIAGGCASSGDSEHLPSSQTPLQAPGAPGVGELTFASDDAAMQAIISAAKAQDHDKVHQILGPAWKELISGDKVEDGKAFEEFASSAAEASHLEKKDADTSILHLGKDDWSFPIPIARTPDGKWFFDTETGKGELLYHRIGANELFAIDVCAKYVDAQRLYQSKDDDGSGIVKYAQRLISSPGKKDGLYWPADAGQEQSPLGPLVNQAASEGYGDKPSQSGDPFHGYRFHILKSQGSDAPGGKYDYVINGNMVAGFALIAWPAQYRSSGIMTFIVGQSGKVYQKDLGDDTDKIARHITEYNPDSSWSQVK